MKKVPTAGFTLVELMVVIGIIGILSSILYANFGSARGSGRDAERQADVQNLQVAIELYKKQNGRYPAQGCNLSGIANERDCGTVPYIVALAPEFISVLPRDPQRGTAEGYSYVTNTAGTTFKVMAQNTVETIVTSNHKLLSCDIGINGICVPPSSVTTPVCMTSNSRFQRSYGAWGGYADGATDTLVKLNTANVICR